MVRPVSSKDSAADSHVRFIYAALAFATFGGFALAAWLPVLAALGRMNLTWVSHAQVHGHLQVAGFAGLFVMGMMTRLAPRFGGGRLAYPALVDAAFWCLVAGLLARTIGQPAAARTPFAMLMVAGAFLELAGAAMFAVSAAATLRPAVARADPPALLMLAGMGWFVVQAAFGAVWLTQLASDGGPVLRPDRDGFLVSIQSYGFLLCVFAGVGLRSFPSFFGMPQPSIRLGRATFLLLQTGLLLWAGGLLFELSEVDATWISAPGQALVGGGVLAFASALGWWRRETRFAAASQPLAWPLRATLAMLTVTGLLLIAAGVDALIRGGSVSTARSDAVRHLFALGVITQGIAAMAQLILPEFASERLVHPPGRWRSSALGAALSGAVLLRGFVSLAGVSGDVRYWSMAAGGALALVAIASLGVMFFRARRTHIAYLGRVAVWRAQSLPLSEAPSPPRRDGTPPAV